MSPSKPVYFTTPDGVKRELRFTFGARKRIVDRFGLHLMEALNKYDVAALPELLYCLMFDEKGNPPTDFSVEQFIESDALEDAPALMATLMEAASRGRVEKNELEALIRAKMQTDMERMTGSISGPSPTNALDGAEPISGNSQNGNSMHSVTDTENSESLISTAPA